MSRSTPAVSVLTCTRDGARFLGETLASVRRQSEQDYEHIVVDDGSVDDTPQILAAAATDDPRLVILRNDVPTGIARAWNVALAHARAPLIARLDHDDAAEPERLAVQRQYLETHPAVVVVATTALTIDADGRTTGRIGKPKSARDVAAQLDTPFNPIVSPTAMMRAEVVRSLGGLRAAFDTAEDYDLWLRVVERADIVVLDAPLLRYRQHPQQASQRYRMLQQFRSDLALFCHQERSAGRPDPAAGVEEPLLWDDTNVARICPPLAALYRLHAAGKHSAPVAEGDVETALANIQTLQRVIRPKHLARMLVDMAGAARKQKSYGLMRRLLMAALRTDASHALRCLPEARGVQLAEH